MPELPEVETMVRALKPPLAGARLQRLEILDPRLCHADDPDHLAARLAGARIATVERRGKWVVIALESPAGLIVIQPRMTGGFWLVPPPHPRHTRLIFHVERLDQPIRYCDARRLGKLFWHPDRHALDAACARSQGTDALQISRRELASRLAATSRGIKPALLDQKILAGIGNIYADEILWRSRIHPMRPANQLTPTQLTVLHAAIRPVLETAIAAEGSSFDAGYRTALGREGGFLAQNDVHRRAGLPCHRCGQPIQKAYLPGLIARPTYLCPKCQRLLPGPQS